MSEPLILLNNTYYISCSNRQCVVYSTWISLQPDSAAAAGLPLQSCLLRSRSVNSAVTFTVQEVEMETGVTPGKNTKTIPLDLTCVFDVFVCPGMVPLPDTAIDFSDLRSQSSRMNERVSHKVEFYFPHYTKFRPHLDI